MKKQITSISAVQTAKVFAVLYFLMSLPFVIMMYLMTSFSHSPFPAFMVIVMPIAYLLIGFIVTVIGAWVYNVVANWIGGVEYTSDSIEDY
jgi:ABC-type multidrug transport system fused ATPase/permease subunit